MITHKEYIDAKELIILYRQQLVDKIKDCDSITVNYDTPLSDIDMSVRMFNCFKYEGCKTLSDILTVQLQKMRKSRNWGAQCERELIELKEKYINC